LLFEGGADLGIEMLQSSLKETLAITLLGFAFTAAVYVDRVRLDPISSLMTGAAGQITLMGRG
jgi:hypothetical protein